MSVRLLVALMLLLFLVFLLCACEFGSVVEDVKGGVQDGIDGVKDKVNEVKDKVSNLITTTTAPPTTTAPVTDAPPSPGMLYVKSADGRSYTVKGHAGSKDKDLVIAAEKDGLPVTAIMQAAFKGKSTLSSIRIPESVVSVGKDAFYGCNGLIKAEGGGLYVDRWVVGAGDFVSAVVLGENTYGIADNAFEGRTRLVSVTLNASLRAIGADAFLGCTSLTEIVVPEENAYYTVRDGALYTKDMTRLIRFFGTQDSFTVPASVTEIAPSAFRDKTALVNLTFQEGSALTVLGDYAFLGCTALTSFDMPKGVAVIGTGAFSGCSALTACTMPEDAACTAIGTGAFRGCSALAAFTVTANVTSIGQNAFYECRSLAAVYLVAGNEWYTETQDIPAFHIAGPALAASALRDTYHANTWTRRTR